MGLGMTRRCALFALLPPLLLSPSGAAPDRAEQPFRFSIIGDRTGGPEPGVYSQVWDEVDRLRPAFVINVGDTIEGGDDNRALAQWNMLRPLFEQYRSYPHYFTPGNHDVFSETSRRMFEKESGRPVRYSFDHGGAHFVVLDNSRTEDLSEEQLRFLDEDLAAHAGRDPTFVFFHKPYWLLPMMLDDKQFRLHQIVTRRRVDYVISGHLHQFIRFERDGVNYVVVGSSGGRLRGKLSGLGFRDGWFYHHVEANVAEGRASLTVHELGQPFGEGRSFALEQWGEAGPNWPKNAAPPAPGKAVPAVPAGAQ